MFYFESQEILIFLFGLAFFFILDWLRMMLPLKKTTNKQIKKAKNLAGIANTTTRS